MAGAVIEKIIMLYTGWLIWEGGMGTYYGKFSGFFLRLCKMLGMIKKPNYGWLQLGFCESFVGSIFIAVVVVGPMPSSSKGY